MADDNDADYETTSKRAVWTPPLVKKFSRLLLHNTVVLQHLYTGGYLKDDPMHQLKKRALEHLRDELGLASIEQVKNKINSFRRFSMTKLRRCADRCGPKAGPEVILRLAPQWLQKLEPHMNLWRLVALSRDKDSTVSATTSTPTVASSRPPSKGRGTQLAISLAQASRTARSLEAKLVLGKIKKLPQGKTDEVKYIWWRMLDVVRQKLTILRDSGISSDQMKGARFTPVESILADIVLLYDDTICTVSESGDYDSMQVLVELFHLAQLHRLEDELAGPERWLRAHRAYKAQSVNISGLGSSLILIQRRWHELKSATRNAFVAFCRPQPGADSKPPSPLYAAIAKRFPHVLTAPLPTWREFVNMGNVIEEDDDENVHLTNEILPHPDEIEGMNLLSAKELAQYERSAKDDEDDLILIEKEIETIDLINIDETKNNSSKEMQYACDDQAQTQIRNKRKDFAKQLAIELDKQLKDIQISDTVTEIELMSQAEPRGTPMYIYDSDDSDIECTEDRIRNIELIASQITSEMSTTNAGVDDIAYKIKKEIINEVDCDDDESSDGDKNGDRGNGDDCGDDDDDDCVEIDPKLLMVTKISLIKVNETPEWKKHVKRQSTIDVTKLNLSLFQPPQGEVQDAPVQGGQCPDVKVKVEKVELEEKSENPKGERQVKSMAKRLISEIMRDETDGADVTSRSRACVRKVRRLMDTVDDEPNRVTKKVKLPNIEEVRINNMSMLTAQVAPLSTDEATYSPDKEADGSALSPGSPDRLQIDEGSERRQGDDAVISQSELERVLKQINTERHVSQGRGGEVSSAAVHCCTARRQRAVNAARTRVAARAGRPPPPLIDLHGTSICVRMKKCVCCCAHLLQASEATDKLYQEAKDIGSALDKLWDDGCAESSESDVPETVDNENSNSFTGKPSTSKKRPKRKAQPEPTPEQATDPLEEWNRQKSLNQQYFNLNLKPQQANKSHFRKFHLISKDNPDAPPKVIFAKAQPSLNKTNYKVLEVNESGKLVKFPVKIAQKGNNANSHRQNDHSNFSISGQLQTNNVQPGNIPSNYQLENGCFSVTSVVSGQSQSKNVDPGKMASYDLVPSGPTKIVQSGNMPCNKQPDNESNFSIVSVVSGQLQTKNVNPGKIASNDRAASGQSLLKIVQQGKTPSNNQPDNDSNYSITGVVSGQLQTENIHPGKIASNDFAATGQLTTKIVQSGNMPNNDQPDNESNFAMISVVSGQVQTKNVNPGNIASNDSATSGQLTTKIVQPGNMPNNDQPDNESNFAMISVVSGQLQTKNVNPGNIASNYLAASGQPLFKIVQPGNTPSDHQPGDCDSGFSVTSVVSGQLQSKNVQPGKGNNVPDVSSIKTPTQTIKSAYKLVTETKNNTKIVTLNQINSATGQSQSAVPLYYKVKTATSHDHVTRVPAKQIKLSEFLTSERKESRERNNAASKSDKGGDLRGMGMKVVKISAGSESQSLLKGTEPGIVLTPSNSGYIMIHDASSSYLKVPKKTTPRMITTQKLSKLAPKPARRDKIPPNSSAKRITIQVVSPKDNSKTVSSANISPATGTSSPPKQLIILPSDQVTRGARKSLLLNGSPSKDGTGIQQAMKVVAAGPSRLLNGSGIVGKRVINTLAGERAFNTPLLGEGSVLTNVTRDNNTSTGRLAPAPTKPKPEANTAAAPLTNSLLRIAPAPARTKQVLIMAEDIRKFYKNRRITTTVESFISKRDPTGIEVLCLDPEEPLLILAEEYYIVTECELSFAHPEYWMLGNLPNSRRILLKNEPKPSTSTGSEVLASPDKMCLEKKTYVKLKDDPLVYARVLSVVRTAQEAHNLLMRSSCLQVISARSGAMSPLSKNYSLGSNVLALSCPVLEAAKALALMLNDLPAMPPPTDDAEGTPARANVNARADVVMMMNNVNRKPIEMVYIDSDEEDNKKPDFKGLENFEDLEEFEL